MLFCLLFFVLFIVILDKKCLDSKRKGDDLDINSAKSRKIERKCVDLIVLGIPWKSTEDVVRRYFEQYGDVVLCEVNEHNYNKRYNTSNNHSNKRLNNDNNDNDDNNRD